jgi:carbon-monoxide dehydrogenase medium subunit
MWRDYLLPGSVEEVLDLLSAYDGRARLIAGGTDVVPQLQEGSRQVEALVDVTRIPGLAAIAGGESAISLGAAVTYRQAIHSPVLQANAAVLVEAGRSVGSPQIRNVATLVGNVVNAMPAADAAIALFALGAELEIASPAGRRWVPIETLYIGPGQSRVDPTREMVSCVRFPALGENQGSAFVRLSRRKALALPVLNVAVVVALAGHAFAWGRIAIGPVAPQPFRAHGAEEAMRGMPADADSIRKVVEIAAGEAQPRSSLLRASREYRQQALRVLLHRALEAALVRAQCRTSVEE